MEEIDLGLEFLLGLLPYIYESFHVLIALLYEKGLQKYGALYFLHSEMILQMLIKNCRVAESKFGFGQVKIYKNCRPTMYHTSLIPYRLLFQKSNWKKVNRSKMAKVGTFAYPNAWIIPIVDIFRVNGIRFKKQFCRDKLSSRKVCKKISLIRFLWTFPWELWTNHFLSLSPDPED